MQQDIRILTLYKQHYLDDYTETLEAQYSCLGYYDGLGIKSLETNHKDTFMPCIWNGTGVEAKKLRGGYGVQNIGIFRMVPKNQVLDDKKEFPYIVVGFLKIKDFSQYHSVMETIEQIQNRETEKLDGERGNVQTYCTFDSADLVVVAKGCSILFLKHIYEKIEDIPDVQYLHTIMGISEEYLKYIKNKPQDFGTWNNMDCHINEKIKAIRMNLVTSGDYSVIDCFKRKLKSSITDWGMKDYDDKEKEVKDECSYIMGHANISIALLNTNVRSLLVMLVPEGILTHQNGIYGNGLYNIESYIELEKDISEIISFKKKSVSSSWCVAVIKKYRDKLDEIAMDDQGLYSYFQAFLHTLNTLAQYEGFYASREEFNLIIPSFQLFNKQLADMIDGKKALDKEMKDVICKYLEYVNSVLYHTIHTNQVYLMIPGYSGTAFSIPIKLNLLYVWYVDKVKNILNDTSRRYAFILIPVMESRPETSEMGIKLKGQERLIAIKISQRILSYPHNLMIVLAHELGHYVGSNMRSRSVRISNLTKTLGQHLAEGICMIEQDFMPEGYDKIEELNDYIQKDLGIEITNNISKRVDEAQPDSNYYLDDIKPLLIRVCKQVLDDRGDGAKVFEIIRNIPGHFHRWAVEEPEDEFSRWQAIYKLQQRLDFNRRQLCISGIIDEVVNQLIKIYGEVYSDMTALALLNCTKVDFEESFYISDGKRNKIESKERHLRIQIADSVVFGGPGKNIVELAEQKEDKLKRYPSNGMKDLADKVYEYSYVQLLLLDYAQKCYQKLEKHIAKKDKSVKQIRDIFGLFALKEENCDKVFEQVVDKLAEYEREIQETYGKNA